jgi:hypothetical protein
MAHRAVGSAGTAMHTLKAMMFVILKEDQVPTLLSLYNSSSAAVRDDIICFLSRIYPMLVK